jgi:hypothetical protein
MNEINNDIPEENTEEVLENKTPADSLLESLEAVIDMMNSGKVNPKDVYPSGRYHGD